MTENNNKNNLWRYSHKELAALYNVSSGTLTRYLKPLRGQLLKMSKPKQSKLCFYYADMVAKVYSFLGEP